MLLYLFLISVGVCIMNNETAVEKLRLIMGEYLHVDFEWPQQGPKAALAILAAFQADPMAYVKLKPLEFIERRNMTWEAVGWDYKIISNRDGTWRVRKGGRILFRRQKSYEAAERKTNEHLCKRVKELF